MATFNGIDYAIFVILFLSVVIGIARGFIKEIISLIAWVAAFVVATLYSVKLAVMFSGAAPQPGTNPIDSVSMASIIISYLSLFIGVLILGSIIKYIANYMIEGSGLSITNRLLGAVFGLVRGCIIVLLAMFFLAFTAITTHALWKDSKLVAVFNPGVKWLDRVAQPYIAEIETKMKKTAKSLNEEDLSDVIKTKPAAKQPAETQPAPTAPAMVPVVPAPAPAAAPANATPAAPVAPATTIPSAAPQTH